jgi:hypothetical protein
MAAEADTANKKAGPRAGAKKSGGGAQSMARPKFYWSAVGPASIGRRLFMSSRPKLIPVDTGEPTVILDVSAIGTRALVGAIASPVPDNSAAR